MKTILLLLSVAAVTALAKNDKAEPVQNPFKMHRSNGKYKGYRSELQTAVPGETFAMRKSTLIPDSVDWRQRGAVTAVKEQGWYCGSCWAFAATGVIEAQHKLKTGRLVNLSEQNLIDCSHQEGNEGCAGGTSLNAFEYVKGRNGIATEHSYPYEGTDGKCRFRRSVNGSTIRLFGEVPSGDEEALKHAVARIGPIAVAIHENADTFGDYTGGIHDFEGCRKDLPSLNHAVLVVGYGTEGGKDYWLVKNSYGTDWGMNGYVKMARNKNNQCGIATSAHYALL